MYHLTICTKGFVSKSSHILIKAYHLHAVTLESITSHSNYSMHHTWWRERSEYKLHRAANCREIGQSSPRERTLQNRILTLAEHISSSRSFEPTYTFTLDKTYLWTRTHKQTSEIHLTPVPSLCIIIEWSSHQLLSNLAVFTQSFNWSGQQVIKFIDWPQHPIGTHRHQ